jgi:hypothetical protein
MPAADHHRRSDVEWTGGQRPQPQRKGGGGGCRRARAQTQGHRRVGRLDREVAEAGEEATGARGCLLSTLRRRAAVGTGAGVQEREKDAYPKVSNFFL